MTDLEKKLDKACEGLESLFTIITILAGKEECARDKEYWKEWLQDEK